MLDWLKKKAKAATTFLGESANKVKNASSKGMEYLNKMKSFGNQVGQFLDDAGPLGKAIKKYGQDKLNQDIKIGKHNIGSVNKLTNQAEKGLKTAYKYSKDTEKAVGGDVEAMKRLANAGYKKGKSMYEKRKKRKA